MILGSANKPPEKLARRQLGEWGREELAFVGAPCNVIRILVADLIKSLSSSWKIAFADAEHSDILELKDKAQALHYTDKIGFKRIDFPTAPGSFQRHALFNECDLVLVNGNHLTAQRQIVLFDPAKSLEAKLAGLTDVRLVILKDKATTVPIYLQPYVEGAAVLLLHDRAGIAKCIDNHLQQNVSPLNGLVLAGGKSTRMGRDKSLLNYHGTTQRDHIAGMLKTLCKDVYLSCNATQADEATLPKIEDTFIGLGPLGGILSAMQTVPDTAWLTIACDLPYLTSGTLDYLCKHRNPSKIATAFMDAAGEFPEPLITIWEPRAYPLLLQALSEGYASPRKVLISSDVVLLRAPDMAELQNVNDLAACNAATAYFKTS